MYNMQHYAVGHWTLDIRPSVVFYCYTHCVNPASGCQT